MTCKDCIHFGVCWKQQELLDEREFGEEQECCEEASRFIVLPCKVGDTVYIVDGTTDGIVVGTITNLEQNIYTSPKEWITFKGNYPFFGELESKDRVDLLLGKTVFLSREDAEKALKERSEGK